MKLNLLLAETLIPIKLDNVYGFVYVLNNPFGTKGAHTGLAPVCALCEADSPEDGSPGCFAPLRSEQGAAPLAALPIPAYLAFENGFDKPFPNAKSKNRTPYIDRLPIFGRRSFSIPNIKIKEVMHYGKTENYPRTGSRESGK